MYGYRARIGYCSPPFVTEGFCYEFYQMAAKGVTLMITTLAVTSLTSPSTKEQMAQSHAKSLEAAKAMARAGADVVVLGGNPINQSRGVENLDAICASLAQEIGTKVVTSTHAQTHALRALGARQVKREHPEADTIHHSCAHWATAHAIEQIEQELGVNVMTSQQAIFWKALRTAGINDRID